jgi:DNA-binding transcriptional MerR regulator
MTETFSDTSGAVAREARVSPPTVRLYSDMGLIEFVLDSRGCRLYRPGTAELVRQIYERRMARRGGAAA